jgi:hypothetical protein
MVEEVGVGVTVTTGAVVDVVAGWVVVEVVAAGVVAGGAGETGADDAAGVVASGAAHEATATSSSAEINIVNNLFIVFIYTVL